MRLQFCVVKNGLFVLLFIACAGGSVAVAQQNVNNQGQLMMTPLNGPATKRVSDSRKSLVNSLNLKMYEAAAGNVSICADDKICLRHAENIKSWLCAASVCEGTDNSKKPLDCFEGASGKYSQKVQDQINSLACSLIKSPNSQIRQAILADMPDLKEGESYLVEDGAYLKAFKGSAVSCEDYIKNYISTYGLKWESHWYRALSGCRILAGTSTREQEEKDYYTWFGVAMRVNKCSDIVNGEMRDTCNALGPTSANVLIH
jgi:hypothetical protein